MTHAIVELHWWKMPVGWGPSAQIGVINVLCSSEKLETSCATYTAMWYL